MNRIALLLTALGLLALAGGLGTDWQKTASPPQPLLHAGTGLPLTLEAVVQDIVWHRETARRLRRFD